MSAEVVYLPVVNKTTLDREIELLQECGDGLTEYAQTVGHLMRLNPGNKDLRKLANRLCRNSMWLDRRWGELLEQRKVLKRTEGSAS